MAKVIKQYKECFAKNARTALLRMTGKRNVSNVTLGIMHPALGCLIAFRVKLERSASKEGMFRVFC